MITIYVEDFNSEITQDAYDKIINSLDLNKLECPKCNHCGSKIHAYYDRAIKTSNGILRLVVLRVKCKGCNATHALLLSTIVPYQVVSVVDQIRIINNDDIKSLKSDKPDIYDVDVYRIKSNFVHHYKQRLISFKLTVDYSMISSCFEYFERQFMQIKRQSNILFLPTT